ncbi:MAG: tyrosine-type recombinase/integrase [Gaiellaceae bacterium]
MARKKEGPPYQRSPGRWSGAIDHGGEKHWVGTFDSPETWKLEAAKLRVRLTEEPEDAPPPPKTIRDFVETDNWPEANGGRQRRRDVTRERMLEGIKPLLRDFGERALDGGISRQEAADWAPEHRGGAKVARTLFGDAVRIGLTERNPFRDLGLAPQHGRRRIRVFSQEEFSRLAEAARRSRADEYGEVLRAIIVWQGTEATRNGETFAVEWDHIHFDTNRVDIVQRVDYKGRLGPPKNGEERTIVLTPPAKRELLRMPRLHERFVFTTVRGNLFRQSSWAYYWHPVRAAFTASLPPSHWLPRRIARNPDDQLDFYELRHRAATWLCEPPPRGLGLSDFDTSIQLGHTDGGVLVSELYSHREEDGALERIDTAWQSLIEEEGDEW